MTTSANEEQKLRKALAGSTGGMTYHSRSLADLQLEQGHSGRFTEKASVVGATRMPNVPRMPEGNPWHSDLVPREGPLGYEINSQEPCGEPFELVASLALSPEDAALATEVSASRRPAPDCAIPLGSQSGASPKSPSWSPGDQASLTAVSGDADDVGEATLIRGRGL
jgi:hypothetical protein